MKLAVMLVTLDQNELDGLFLRQRGIMETQFTMYVRHQYFVRRILISLDKDDKFSRIQIEKALLQC